ncbi:hypothetical protein HPB51_018157 [Rhipicephalus microplus]|uniref:DDE-1 domain-containing protein n=1 Tax=Rhipicephalus microplus TaxID=6941 RepID=A0A9J6D6P5_RHIMP|nr:hypothetical protein HPB51_018157 [Rhipicephalus microplus]
MVRTRARTVSRRLGIATKNFRASSRLDDTFHAAKWTVAEAADVIVLATSIREQRRGDRFFTDEWKLPPYVILKRKTISKAHFPGGIQIRAQAKGWMTRGLMVDWIKTVWERRAGALLLPSLLVSDSFRDHLVDSVRTELMERHTEIAVIPGV